jgi:hypothetical protein
VSICDCEPETPGVLECALRCVCRCHDLEAQCAELKEWKKSAVHALSEWHAAREIIGGAQIGDGPTQWARRIRAMGDKP